jgi:hypothetical protein
MKRRARRKERCSNWSTAAVAAVAGNDLSTRRRPCRVPHAQQLSAGRLAYRDGECRRGRIGPEHFAELAGGIQFLWNIRGSIADRREKLNCLLHLRYRCDRMQRVGNQKSLAVFLWCLCLCCAAKLVGSRPEKVPFAGNVVLRLHIVDRVPVVLRLPGFCLPLRTIGLRILVLDSNDVVAAGDGLISQRKHAWNLDSRLTRLNNRDKCPVRVDESHSCWSRHNIAVCWHAADRGDPHKDGGLYHAHYVSLL